MLHLCRNNGTSNQSDNIGQHQLSANHNHNNQWNQPNQPTNNINNRNGDNLIGIHYRSTDYIA